MSGICGIVFRDQDRWLSHSDLLPMLRAVGLGEHGQGFRLILGSVGIGAQRFSRHLAAVAEVPLDGKISGLAFHGSLYNLAELVSHGIREADLFVEILGHFLKAKTAFLRSLRGEFALAVWDAVEQTLYLVTDRFRVHPLFYYLDQDKLVFASRIKGILACPFHVESTIDLEAIADVVGASFIPTPRTIFREVKKLPPGHILAYHNGEIRLSPYWEINFLHSDNGSDEELAQRLRHHLSSAISVRMDRDRGLDRVGTFLSGGVDSGTVTGLLTQLVKRPIKSFSIGFNEQKYNEIDYARIAARAFGAEHYEYFVTPRDTSDAIPVLMESFDEPYANASAIATYFCAKLAKEHGIEILFAGDGGDELFAGNERYSAQRRFEYYYKIPGWLRDLIIKPLITTLAGASNLSFFVQGAKYIQRASIPYPQRLTSYGVFKIISMAQLFEDSLLETVGKEYDPDAPTYSYYYRASAQTELDRQLYIDLKLAISDNDLFKVTRMTESAGIMVHFPFLDHVLAEFAATVPADVKMRGRKLRSFFKSAYADLLPRETRRKTKHGFGIPIAVWLRTDKQLNDLMHDLVLSSQALQRGYFRKRALHQLIELHKTDTTSFYGTVLWNLMVVELWHRNSAPMRMR